MKKLWMVLVPMLALGTALYGEDGNLDRRGNPGGTSVDVSNQIGASQDVSTTSIAEGGSSWNDNTSASTSQVNIDTQSVSNYQTRTPPLTTLPPYLPYWTHGGWGTVKAYFPNGPTLNDRVYETTFDPENPQDMRELRSVLSAMPHDGLLSAVGGMFNSLAVALFDAPDRYHHGRGVEIVSSVVRDRRPEGKPLLVFIDSNVDMNLLAQEGYAYVGKVSIEGDVERNWDQAYKAAVAEALLWDADILLISGGMKGVTVGSNVTFPSAAAGYAQTNYSLSLFGSKATGITEGKGKAVVSADAYRFRPGEADRRSIPASLYDRIRIRPQPVSQQVGAAPPLIPSAARTTGESAAIAGKDSRPAIEPAKLPETVAPGLIRQSQPGGATQDGYVLPPPAPEGAARQEQASFRDVPQPESQVCEEAAESAPSDVVAASEEPGDRARREVSKVAVPTSRSERRTPGIQVSRKLLSMAGFQDTNDIAYLALR